MAKNKMTTKTLEGKYDENCLEESFGDLTWFKEINDKGEVIENCLMQDVDGGVRGVDVFGNEHFDKVEYGKDKYNLYANGEIVKRYARNEHGAIRPCDENYQFAKIEQVKYHPVAAENKAEIRQTSTMVRSIASSKER